jgi:hypothetical protein
VAPVEPFCGDNISIGKVHKENEQRVKRTEKRRKIYLYLYLHTTVYVFWASPRPHIPVFPPVLFLYANLGAKGAQKLFKTLAFQRTELSMYPSKKKLSNTIVERV